jgi:uncharacterized CHY-type Zn-finger protein
MKLHVNNIHDKSQEFVCEFCQKSLNSKQYLKRHMKACSAKVNPNVEEKMMSWLAKKNMEL